MQQESEVEKTAKFTRHVIQGIIVIVIIIAVIIGSVFVVGFYEVHQTISTLNQAIPLTTIKTATQDVTVNVPFTVTITTNQNSANTQYSIYCHDNVQLASGIMTKKTLTLQLEITSNQYQTIAKDDLYSQIPNSLSESIVVLLIEGNINLGGASTNIVINNPSTPVTNQTPNPTVQPTPPLLITPTPTPTITLAMSSQKVFINQPFSITITVNNYNLPCKYSIWISHDNNFWNG